MELTIFGTSKNGQYIYLDSRSSHAATHLADTPNLSRLAREALGKINVPGGGIVVPVDMGRIVGQQDLVSTCADDEIRYAKRFGREIYTRFTLSQSPAPSSTVSLVIRVEQERLVLASTWVGPASPPFPGDKFEVSESRDFWSRHALAWGAQEVDPATITDCCPW